MQYSDITKGRGSLDAKRPEAFLARLKWYVGVLTITRKPKAPALTLDHWYRMNAAAKAQGEFWFHTLLGR